MKHYLDLAYRVTANSSHHQHHMACVIVSGGRILSVAANGGTYNSHAEMRAIRRAGEGVRGATAIVVRANKGCSRPCHRCWLELIQAGVRTVSYIDGNNMLVSQRLS